MKQKIYVENDQIIAGITLKDATTAEQNNMAFNVCQNKVSVLENRQQLADILQTDVSQFVCANQTHSANFLKVEKQHIGLGAHNYESAVFNTDALYTFEKNIVLSSFTADCVPVLFYNRKIELIGAIHSGWQGSVKEITRHLFDHLKTTEACEMGDLHVIIGPALSQEKFEVDADVYEQFKALGYAQDFMYYNEETKKYHINNQLTVRKQCELAGVPIANIEIDPMCTFLDESGFSYRQSKQAGRHLSFILQK